MLLTMSLLLPAAVVDGIVATVGRAVITDSAVRRGLRAAALLAREPLRETRDKWEEARDRLIEQALVKEEIRISRYPVAQPDEVRNALAQVKQQLGAPEQFARQLREYRLTEADVTENLSWQITFARFITYRFRPSVQVTESVLRQYYDRWRPAGEKPAFEDARERLESDYVAEEAAQALERWLREVRPATRIETIEPVGMWP